MNVQGNLSSFPIDFGFKKLHKDRTNVIAVTSVVRGGSSRGSSCSGSGGNYRMTIVVVVVGIAIVGNHRHGAKCSGGGGGGCVA